MVATVLRLKLRILRHTLRKDVWRRVVLIGGALWALSLIPSVLGAMAWLGGQPFEVGRDVLVVGGSILTLGWAVVPVLVPGLDDSLEINRFATFGVSARRLAPALLVAALLGVPTIFTAVVCFLPALAWWGAGGPAAAAVAVVAAPLALMTCVLASRLATALGGLLLGSRRSRELGAVGGVLLVVLAVPAVITVGSLGLEGVVERVPGVAAVLGWTPLGLAWAAPAVAAEGSVLQALLRLLVAVVWLLLGLAAWAALLHRSLVRPPSRGGQSRRTADAVLPRRTARTPGLVAARAVYRRALRYWATDPRFVSAALGAVVAPVAIVLLVATVVDAPAAVALSMGPLMAGTIGWGRHNDVAFDGSAFWLHVSAHPPGWADRAGRALGALAWGAPVTVVVSVAGALVAGRADLATAAVGAGIGVLCAGLAVSAVFSTVLTYPVPAAGSSPFAAELGAVGASMVAQLVTSAVTGLLCVPILVLYGAAMWWSPGLAVPTLLVGVIGGIGILAAGVVAGGRLYDRRASRLLVRLG